MGLVTELRKHWQDYGNLVLGIWLFVSPIVLGYNLAGNAAAIDSYVMGVGIVLFAVAALYQPQPWEEWVSLILGVWLIVAPIVLGFTTMTVAMLNHVIVGVLIGGDAIMALLYPPERRIAGGHPG